jgi:flagellin
MAQVINTNILSLTSQRNLSKSASAMQTSMERLSSGLRINSAKDDAAGLAISERFTTQIRGLNQAVRNANDGVSFAQTAEGALGTVGDSLQRIRELAVQSANDTNSTSDRAALNNEVAQLISEINRVARSTEFNGQAVLDGSLSDLVFQVGANQGQTISVDGVDAKGSNLGARVMEGTTFEQDQLDALVAADDLSLNGRTVDLSGLSAGDDVSDLISAINSASGTTGITAEAGSSTTTDAITVAALTSGSDYSFKLNDVIVNFTAGASATATATAVEQAVAAVSVQTGVEVSRATAALTFSNSTGEDIVFAADANTPTAHALSTTFSPATTTMNDTGQSYYAGVVLSGDISPTDTDFAVSGTWNGTDGGSAIDETQTNYTVNGVDVTTRDNATTALRTLDFALQKVNGLRAELGSVQTRFESTISNLEITAENMTAARSRIRDADFAKETAELTRVQILQQAGISMLSQANAQPQNVLALLQ